MTYTMSPKRKQKDFLQNNWKVSLEVFMLRNQGWTFTDISRKFNLSPQRIQAIYKKMSKLTVEEAEKVTDYVASLGVDNS